MKIEDMHSDTIYELLKRRREGAKECLVKNSLHMDLEKMKQADYLLQNFSLFVDQGKCEDPYEEAKAEYAVFVEEMEKNKDVISQVFSYGDIVKNLPLLGGKAILFAIITALCSTIVVYILSHLFLEKEGKK